MFRPGLQADLLGLLQNQDRYYNTELGNSHKALSKQYEKLARTELAIVERHERGLTRKDKKKLQWSRALAKKAVQELESQQAWLHGYLRQRDYVISSYGERVYNAQTALWSAQVPPTPCSYQSLSPLSPISPWPVSSYHTSFHVSQPPAPQYWDLSMLRERRRSSPFAPSADSGFYEPSTHARPFGLNEVHDPGHSLSHELVTSSYNGAVDNNSSAMAPLRKKSSISEKDDLPELVTPTSPTRTGAEMTSPRKRRYSENAIQLIESRLAAPKHTHSRATSTGSVPPLDRAVSDHSAVGVINVAASDFTDGQ